MDLDISFLNPQLFSLDIALSHNDVLSEEEEAEARILIFRTKRSHRELVTMLTRSQDRSTRKSLHAQRAKLDAHISSLQTVCAVHRRLPVEILAEIFQRCVSPEAALQLFKPFIAPIDHVCLKWRRVAFGTPSLWDQVSIDYGDWSDHAHVTRLGKTRLSHSGNALISLSIYAGIDNLRGAITTTPTFISDIVIPSITRLRSLKIHSLGWMMKNLLVLSSTSADSLRSIDLLYHGNRPSRMETAFLSAARSLRSVRFEAQSHPSSLPLPWTQLTELSLLTCVHPDLALSILHQCTLLVICEIRLGGTGDLTHIKSQSSIVRMDRLLSLDIRIPTHNKYPSLVQRLALPSMTSFKLLDAFQHLAQTMPELMFAPITRSGRLETLELSVRVTTDDLWQLLHNISTIVALHITNGDSFSDDTLDAIGHGALVPKLETLECMADRMDSFLDMIERRWAPVGSTEQRSALQSVTVRTMARAYTREARERVDMLRAVGFDIIVYRLR